MDLITKALENRSRRLGNLLDAILDHLSTETIRAKVQRVFLAWSGEERWYYDGVCFLVIKQPRPFQFEFYALAWAAIEENLKRRSCVNNI